MTMEVDKNQNRAGLRAMAFPVFVPEVLGIIVIFDLFMQSLNRHCLKVDNVPLQRQINNASVLIIILYEPLFKIVAKL